jgi:hypothetical protein
MGENTLTVKIDIRGPDGGSWGSLEEQLELTDIPYAYSLKRQQATKDEKAGIGDNRLQAAIAWLFNNHGPKLVPVDQVPAIYVESMIEHARRSGQDLGLLLFEALSNYYEKIP